MNPATLFTQGGGSSATSDTRSGVGPVGICSFGGLSFGASSSPVSGINGTTLILVLGAVGVTIFLFMLHEKKG